MLDLEEIKKRCEAATLGPWDVFVLHADGTIITIDGRFEIRTPDYDVCAEIPGSAPIRRLSDAKFIAHARSDIPALIAEVERLREVASGLDKQIELLLCPLCDQGINQGHSPDCPNARA